MSTGDFDLDMEQFRPDPNCCLDLHLYKGTGRIIQRNGAVEIKDYCKTCGKIISGSKKGTKLQRLTLPVIRDNRRIYGPAPEYPCDHCGEVTQLHRHHWAPWALFDDADAWPTSDLCPDCHQLWHRKVTPNMRRQGAA